MFSINKVDEEGKHLENALLLFKEYFEELNENLCFQNFEEELKHPLHKYGAPGGALFVAYYNNQAAGCIALQRLQQDGVCEMKRLFVRPQFRKNNIGGQLVKVILQEAKAMNYNKMVLDTLQRLEAAIQLYIKHGFKNTSAYYDNPLPGVVYMETSLR